MSFIDILKNINSNVLDKIENYCFRLKAEKEVQTLLQTKELQKQTEILEEAKEITKENANCVKEIATYTQENQKSSNKQFFSSIIIAGVSLFISIFAIVLSCISSIKSENLLKEQIKNQKQIIEIINVDYKT